MTAADKPMPQPQLGLQQHDPARVAPEHACPRCGERRCDQLVLGEDEHENEVSCASCGETFSLDADHIGNDGRH